ncbi:MAG: hypothetical protein R3332_08420 [Pseudohongiellaceae bacterium]|nr:hypothetical protein [Pseudohongiellaceae bacterium]
MATAKTEKKPGRPKNPAPKKKATEGVTKTPDDLIEQEAAFNQARIEEEQNLVVIDQTYGENLPYDKTRLENETQFYLRESASSMLEAGRRLILLKEHEKHGEFIGSLDRIGLSPRAAQKMMQVAVKFAKAPTLAHLGKSKMLELMVEDDDDLEALADGGTVAGLKLDDIDKMSVRELKSALRKAREKAKAEAEVTEKLLESKDEKINQLDREFIERTKRVKQWSGVVSEITSNVMTMSGAVIMNINHLAEQIDQILQEMDNFDLSDGEAAAIVEPFGAQINSLSQHLSGLTASFDNNLAGYLPVHDTPYVPLPDVSDSAE